MAVTYTIGSANTPQLNITLAGTDREVSIKANGRTVAFFSPRGELELMPLDRSEQQTLRGLVFEDRYIKTVR